MNIYEIITYIELILFSKKEQKNQQLASFEKAIPYVLKHEGGFSNDKDDNGGITNYGLSQKYLEYLAKKEPYIINEVDLNYNKKVDSYDICNMNLDKAKEIYYNEWWEKYGFGKLNYQPLATKLFDMAVNMGAARPIQWLRSCCDKFPPSKSLSISDAEAQYINSLSEIEKNMIVDKIEDLAIDFYKSLAHNNPSQQKYLSGWIKRTTDKISF